MNKYRLSFENCYTKEYSEEFNAHNDDEARKVANTVVKDYGNQVTGTPELICMGRIIEL